MRAKILAAAVLVMLLLPAAAHAHLYDYEYVGLPFDWFGGATYTPADHVTISLLTDHPLSFGERGFADNQSSEMISFIMSDGYQTMSLADAGYSQLQIFDGLKADGTPFGWWIWLSDNPDGTGNTVSSENSVDGAYDIGMNGTDFGRNFTKGSWSMSVQCASSPVPEPSTALLLAAGFAGMCGATWWRRKSAPR